MLIIGIVGGVLFSGFLGWNTYQARVEKKTGKKFTFLDFIGWNKKDKSRGEPM